MLSQHGSARPALEILLLTAYYGICSTFSEDAAPRGRLDLNQSDKPAREREPGVCCKTACR